jgi:hypothetical protein
MEKDWFDKVLENQLTEIEFNTQAVRSECAPVSRKLINLPYENLSDELLPHDLVICSNVIDQCKQPRSLVELLKRKTAKNGYIALSCTYQWNDKHVQDPSDLLTDVTRLFGGGWKLIGETDIEFKCRRAERFWQTFLSHVVVYSRDTD